MKRLGIVISVLIVVAITSLAWHLIRPKADVRLARESRPEPPEPMMATKPAVPTPQPRSRPTTFPNAREWRAQHSYISSRGAWVSNFNIDSDDIYDRTEIARYGTLRYNSRTERRAPRMNLPPPAKPDPDDRDRDGLHDTWEKGYFGTLKYGTWDDPDGDGYPNLTEYNQLMSPVSIDLKNPKAKPKEFPPATVRHFRPSFSTQSREFWEAQEKAAKRVAAGDTGPGPAVKGFKWQKPKPKPKPPAPKRRQLGPLDHRFTDLATSALGPARDSDADGLADEWERHYFKDLSQARQDDPDGDGFPNVIEWYRLTDPTKVDLMELRFKPAKLEDLPPPRTPWDHGWDIHSREFWEIQERLRAERAATRPAAAGGGA